MQIYLIFDLINVNDNHSPWDRDQIGIKLGTDYIIYQKLANFMYKRISMLARLKWHLWHVNVYFTKQNKMKRCD